MCTSSRKTRSPKRDSRLLQISFVLLVVSAAGGTKVSARPALLGASSVSTAVKRTILQGNSPFLLPTIKCHCLRKRRSCLSSKFLKCQLIKGRNKVPIGIPFVSKLIPERVVKFYLYIFTRRRPVIVISSVLRQPSLILRWRKYPTVRNSKNPSLERIFHLSVVVSSRGSRRPSYILCKSALKSALKSKILTQFGGLTRVVVKCFLSRMRCLVPSHLLRSR